MKGMSPDQAARIAGFAYLGVFLLGIFANLFASEKLIVTGNAAATAKNLMEHALLFRLGIAAWLIVIVFDLTVAWALYLFLQPVDKGLSMLAAAFRAVFAAIFAYSFVDKISALHVLGGGGYLTAFTPAQLQSQAMLLLDRHQYGVHASYVFFGLHIFLIGYLILKSGTMPRILGVLLIIASAGYLIDSLGNFVSPEYAADKTLFLVFVAVPAILSEFSLTVWLLAKGGRARGK
jgi:uncharacterized protein DUF4386